jgi:isocitrate/isopropylmalate dehydrogenase
MAKSQIAWLPGDGVGVDVLEAAEIVLKKLELNAQYVRGDIGWDFWCREGDALPPRTIEEGDELEISDDAIVNKTLTKEFPTAPLPKSRQAIIDAGGLIPYTRARLVKPLPEQFSTRWQRSLGNLTARILI